MSDRTTSALGMRRPWMVIGLVGGSVGILIVALAPSVPVVLVGWCIAQLLLQRLARRAGGRAAGPGPDSSTRPGLRRPGYLPADRIGERDLRGPAVHRKPARHVPGAVRDRRHRRPALRADAEGPPAGQGGQAGLVAAGVRQHLLRQSEGEPRLRLGLRQPVPAGAGVRLPDHLPGLLPARTRSAARRAMCPDRSSWAHSSSPP